MCGDLIKHVSKVQRTENLKHRALKTHVLLHSHADSSASRVHMQLPPALRHAPPQVQLDGCMGNDSLSSARLQQHPELQLKRADVAVHLCTSGHAAAAMDHPLFGKGN